MADYEDLEKFAKRANQRLRQLEKSGVAELSSAYRELTLRAYDQRAGMTITKSGNIAFRRDFSKMSAADLAELSESLESFFDYKTTTVTRTRRAYEQSYETYQERASRPNADGKVYGNLTRQQYNVLWTSNINKTFGYAKVIRLMEETGIDDVSAMEEALAQAIEDQADLKRELSQDELAEYVYSYMEENA